MAKEKKTQDPAQEPEAQTTPPEGEAPKTTADPEAAQEPEATQDPAQGSKEPQPLTTDTPLPCTATVAASLAILRRTTGPGTAKQLKPVATLKQGTQVTVRAVIGEDAQLANGLWTKAAFLSV